MKRSQRFNSSLCFGDDQQQLRSRSEGRAEELSPKKSSDGIAVTELQETELAAEGLQPGIEDNGETKETQGSALFRPEGLWMAITRCLFLQWPTCLPIKRQNNRKITKPVDHNQSKDTLSSPSSGSLSGSSSSSSTLYDMEVTLLKEEVRSRGVKSCPPTRYGVSYSYPKLQRANGATDSVLVTKILEKEMFLRIELIYAAEKRESDLQYWAEWKLSGRTKELAAGVWLPRRPKNDWLTH